MDKAELIDGFQFFKTLSFRKVINGFLLRASYLFSTLLGAQIHWGSPEFLSIEPTNLCNLKCPECPSGNNNLKRARLFLSYKDYVTAINKAAPHLSYLQLFFQGEPFMHPKIQQFIEYAVLKNVYTCISTNGQFLNQTTCENIVASGLHRLIISVDGATQETYGKYRIGGSIDKIKDGLTYLNQAKADRKAKTPYILMQFVVLSHNEHEINSIKQLANDFKVSLQIKTAQIEDFKNNGNNLIPKNLSYSRYKPNNKGLFILNRQAQFKCKRIWYGAVLSAQNQLLPCCFDKEAKYPYNTKGEGYSYWKGNNAIEFRKFVWNYSPDIEMCNNCSEGVKTIIKKA